jgi:HD-GYP domain-containing protein (c-di-GMP phosphodiesterase class II)
MQGKRKTLSGITVMGSSALSQVTQPLRLNYPVCTLDKQLLLPENTVISTKTIDTLISTNSQTSYKTYSLFEYGSVKKDIFDSLQEHHYPVIFSEQEKTATIMRILEDVHLMLPVLESLEYFKEYDTFTYRHILMVFALSTLLSIDLLADKGDREHLIKEFLAGPTHDFGKICVPLDILQKKVPITQPERNMLEHHALAGYVLLSYYYRDRHNFFARVARDHHERKNGSGYPRHIKLRDQLIEIVAVTDVYDALISPRPYRPISYDNRTALEEITAMAERGQFNWKVVKALVALNRASKPHFDKCVISLEKRGTPPPYNTYGIIVKG